MASLLELTETDLAAVEHLAALGDVSPSRLGELLGLTSGGVAIVIKRLERGGHVIRRSHPGDARRALLRLSEPTAQRYRGLKERLADDLPDTPQECREMLEVLAKRLEVQALRLELEVAASRPAADVRRVPSLWQ